MRISTLVALLAAGAVAAGCGSTDSSGAPAPDPVPTVSTPSPSTSTSTSTSTSPSTSPSGRPAPAPSTADRPPRFSDWQVGAEPLPLRPDGLGVMGATPPRLRDRRLPTTDLLPPPTDGRFASSIAPITPQLRRRMGESWSPQCPVGLDGLRYLNVSFWGFDDSPHTGELVLAADQADDVVSVFRALFRARYPIEEMRLVTTADLDAAPTGDGNNTAALVCRPKTGQTSGWSAHAYGLAIDLNPFVNPYEKGDVVLPERARSYLDRDRRRPGMVGADSLAVREFARIGWTWGGSWSSLKDYQHFSATGT